MKHLIRLNYTLFSFALLFGALSVLTSAFFLLFFWLLFGGFFFLNAHLLKKREGFTGYRGWENIARFFVMGLHALLFFSCLLFAFYTQNAMGLYFGCCNDVMSFFENKAFLGFCVFLSVHSIYHLYFLFAHDYLANPVRKKQAVLFIAALYFLLVSLSAYRTYQYTSGEKCLPSMTLGCAYLSGPKHDLQRQKYEKKLEWEKCIFTVKDAEKCAHLRP
jgi:hypothetical protein